MISSSRIGGSPEQPAIPLNVLVASVFVMLPRFRSRRAMYEVQGELGDVGMYFPVKHVGNLETSHKLAQ
jgi:hypothetical protein